MGFVKILNLYLAPCHLRFTFDLSGTQSELNKMSSKLKYVVFGFKELSERYADYCVLSTLNMKGKGWEVTGHIKQKVFQKFYSCPTTLKTIWFEKGSNQWLAKYLRLYNPVVPGTVLLARAGMVMGSFIEEMTDKIILPPQKDVFALIPGTYEYVTYRAVIINFMY